MVESGAFLARALVAHYMVVVARAMLTDDSEQKDAGDDESKKRLQHLMVVTCPHSTFTLVGASRTTLQLRLGRTQVTTRKEDDDIVSHER